MKNFTDNLNNFVAKIIQEYNKKQDSGIEFPFEGTQTIITLSGMYGGKEVAEELVHSIMTLVINDLDVGDAYYTKTDGEPSLKKFMVNEARLRKANESRGRMKNKIDELFLKLVGEATSASNIRITNIDSLSALLDRLATERIKEYNFRNKQNKLYEADFQLEVSKHILTKIRELFAEVNLQNGYKYISEKRTFDENKLIKDVNKVLKEV